jgi:hypothetical protein
MARQGGLELLLGVLQQEKQGERTDKALNLQMQQLEGQASQRDLDHTRGMLALAQESRQFTMDMEMKRQQMAYNTKQLQLSESALDDRSRDRLVEILQTSQSMLSNLQSDYASERESNSAAILNVHEATGKLEEGRILAKNYISGPQVVNGETVPGSRVTLKDKRLRSWFNSARSANKEWNMTQEQFGDKYMSYYDTGLNDAHARGEGVAGADISAAEYALTQTLADSLVLMDDNSVDADMRAAAHRVSQGVGNNNDKNLVHRSMNQSGKDGDVIFDGVMARNEVKDIHSNVAGYVGALPGMSEYSKGYFGTQSLIKNAKDRKIESDGQLSEARLKVEAASAHTNRAFADVMGPDYIENHPLTQEENLRADEDKKNGISGKAVNYGDLRTPKFLAAQSLSDENSVAEMNERERQAYIERNGNDDGYVEFQSGDTDTGGLSFPNTAATEEIELPARAMSDQDIRTILETGGVPSYNDSGELVVKVNEHYRDGQLVSNQEIPFSSSSFGLPMGRSNLGGEIAQKAIGGAANLIKTAANSMYSGASAMVSDTFNNTRAYNRSVSEAYNTKQREADNPPPPPSGMQGYQNPFKSQQSSPLPPSYGAPASGGPLTTSEGLFNQSDSSGGAPQNPHGPITMPNQQMPAPQQQGGALSQPQNVRQEKYTPLVDSIIGAEGFPGADPYTVSNFRTPQAGSATGYENRPDGNIKYNLGSFDPDTTTFGDVRELHKNNKAYAIGAGQFTPATFDEMQKKLGIKDDEMYNKPNQRRMIVALIEQEKDVVDFISGASDDVDKAARAIARRWRSFPDPATGKSISHAAGDTSRISLKKVKKILNDLKDAQIGQDVSQITEESKQLLGALLNNIKR